MRLPLTIWWSTAADLWRLLLLTTAVFVSVVAFAVTVKPLADGNFGPLDAVKFMLLAIPPMLQYVLPFAAGFGATLAYHRFASQNETLACHAGGISHHSLLLPSAMTGVILAVTLLLLSNSLIPRFLRSMEELVKEDATRLIINRINRGHAIRMENFLVFADRAIEVEPDAGTIKKFLLRGLLVVYMEGDEVRGEATAPKATAWLLAGTGQDSWAEGEGEGPSDGMTLRVEPQNLKVHESDGNRLSTSPVITKPVPNAFSDDPKFLTWTELERLREEPELMNWVESRRRELAAALAQRATLAELRLLLRTENVAELTDGFGQPVRIFASGMYGSQFGQSLVPIGAIAGEPTDKVVIVEYERAGLLQVYRAADASVRARGTPTGEHAVSIELTLRNFSADRAGGDDPSLATAPINAEHGFGGLRLVQGPAADFTDMGIDQLLGLADQRLEHFPDEHFIRSPRDDLRRRVDRLMNEITSKQHERLAMSAACLVMVLTGAVMAMRLKDSVPLVVYLWSFFPALAAVLTISAGQQSVHKHGLIGLPLLWGGVLGLAVYTLLEIRKLSRH